MTTPDTLTTERIHNAASEWRPTSWKLSRDMDPNTGDGMEGPTITLMVSPFYEGERYAVRRRGRCLNTSGKWEYEPMPSSRDDAFYERCRFKSFEEAAAAVNAAEKVGGEG